MKNKDKLQWVEISVPLNSVQVYKNNPRTITEKQFEKLKKSLVECGYNQRLLITCDNMLISGHQRLRAMKDLGWEECNVLQASRELSEDEFDRVLLGSNHNNGSFDMDMLCNYDLDFLHDLGIDAVSNIPPIEKNVEAMEKSTGGFVRCPECDFEFKIEGNEV